MNRLLLLVVYDLCPSAAKRVVNNNIHISTNNNNFITPQHKRYRKLNLKYLYYC